MSQYKFHGDLHEMLPWQASYTLPTKSVQVVKQTVKLQPKNGSDFGNRNSTRLRIEFPADQMLNVLNSTLSYNLSAGSPTDYAALLAGHANLGTPAAPLVAAGDGWANFSFGQLVLALDTSQVTGGALTNFIPIAYKPFYNALKATTKFSTLDFYAGWFFRITSGSYAGKITRLTGSSYSGTTLTLLFEENMQPFVNLTNGDSWEVIPGTRLQPTTGADAMIARLRVMYGSLPIEDLNYYGDLARTVKKMGVSNDYNQSLGAMLDGQSVGRLNYNSTNFSGSSFLGTGSLNDVLRAECLAMDLLHDSKTLLMRVVGTLPLTAAPVPRTVDTFLLSGLFGQPKLIPLKWMAAQLALEIEFAPAHAAFITGGTSDDFAYNWTNVNFITELLEFDTVFQGTMAQYLQSGKQIPLKFNSWDSFSFNIVGTVTTPQINTRAKSVKSILAVIKDVSSSAQNLYVDSGRFWHALGEQYLLDQSSVRSTRTPRLTNIGNQGISQFQYRIGARYQPAQPVNCDNGGAEAFAELLKVTDFLGDYSRSLTITPYSWSSYYQGGGEDFIMAMVTEVTDAFPGAISGMNAEEQSDVQLLFKCDAENSKNLPVTVAANNSSKQCYVFVNFDSLLFISWGNAVDLVK